MRKFLFSLVCVALSGALSAGTAFGAANGTDRPFRASGSGTGTLTPTGFEIIGTSINSHLGQSDFVTVGVCTEVGCTTTITATAANGDTLILAGSGNEATFTGGTGRFAGASGTSTLDPHVSFDDPSNPDLFHITFTQVGTISY
jgi:hypothetical protein